MGHKWDRFKAGFGSFDHRKQVWEGMIAGLALELARMGDMLDQLDPLLAQPLMVRRSGVLQQFEVGKVMAQQASGLTAKARAMSKLEGVEQDAYDLLKEIKAALRADPVGLAGQVGGLALLDELVGEVKWGKDRRADLDFVSSALKVRYGLTELTVPTGGQERRSLKALYEVLGTLPEDHVRTNPSLVSLVHKRAPETAEEEGLAGVYLKDTQRVVLVMKDVEREGSHEPDCAECTDPSIKPTGTIEGFKGTTVHEVGHAVDDRLKIMERNEGEDKTDYGAWRYESTESVVEALGADKGYFTTFDTVPRAFLVEVLSSAILGEDPSKTRRLWQERGQQVTTLPAREDLLRSVELRAVDQVRIQHDLDDDWPGADAIELEYGNVKFRLSLELGEIEDNGLRQGTQIVARRAAELILKGRRALDAAVDQALDEYGKYSTMTPPWDAMERHEATALCRWIFDRGVKGKRGLWAEGTTGATRARTGDRVYTVSNNGRWFSYSFAARATGVSRYQFNAPPEWFAELYMYYFNGKLPETHPAVDAFLADLRT